MNSTSTAKQTAQNIKKTPKRILPGKAFPLGATADSKGVNFAIYAENATAVELCLFADKDDHSESEIIKVEESHHRVWHVYVSGLKPGQLYGYRIYGPYEPEQGYRFNPNKLLIDPYAKAISGTIKWHDSIFGYEIGNEAGDLSFSTVNNAAFVPKSIVVDPNFDWEDDQAPQISYNKTIIYEAHVKGLTLLNKNIPEEIRGTYAAIGHPETIKHLKSLNITSIELMPVHHFVSDRHLEEKGLSNYWGYNTIGFFAPDIRYSSNWEHGGQVAEFKEMVKALHKAGIEVILDVVYNHTAEGNHFGPTLCYRGVDNSAYYRLTEDRRYYMDYTGTGNTLNAMMPNVLRMIMDSLRYWILEMHVDGFRFDLAPALARELHAVDRLGSFFDIIHQDPVIAQVKLIAEPWDIGEGGYQVGKFPPGWAEWNGLYRDCIRDYWRGADSMLSEFAKRFTGSADLYENDYRRPTASVNFITAHDGFTLNDLVSYNEKHNWENGENNQDGESHNRSWNCGVEGPTQDEDVIRLRKKQKRNFLTTLFLSQGIPMLLAGDEMGRTQGGNNNAYCQDNEVSWVDWENADTEQLAFTRKLIHFYKSHPVFTRRRWFKGAPTGGSTLEDIAWFLPEGTLMTEDHWNHDYAKSLGVFLNGKALGMKDQYGDHIIDDSFYLMFNAHYDFVPYRLPPKQYGIRWMKVLDTNEGEVDMSGQYFEAEEMINVPERSVIVLMRRPDSDKGESSEKFPRTIGVNFLNEKLAHAKVWSPFAKSVKLVLEERNKKLLLKKTGHGYWELETNQLKKGDLYRFSINGDKPLPDPASVSQPMGVHGPSKAIDISHFDWTDDLWQNPSLEDYIVYEVHTGTFTNEGSFAAIETKLNHLKNLGITAIEIMPVAQFPGNRNWGYDGVFPFAVQDAYGGAEGLKHLVNACHEKNLAVVLDVVYNHLGPEGNYLSAYGPYFTEKYHTPWGAAINFDDDWCEGVRNYFIENVLMWFRDFHIDALRLDAVHAIKDSSTVHILQEFRQQVDALAQKTGRTYYFIVEMDLNDPRYINAQDIGGYGMDAQWIDEFHHALKVTATGEKSGYYEDFNGIGHLAKSYRDAYVYDGQFSIHRKKRFGLKAEGNPGRQFVVFSQNHDQVGNRMLGERNSQLVSFEMLKLMAGAVFVSPYVPMLFMGEEWGETNPFLYFISHTDPALVEATRKGRREEFAAFHDKGEAPDPASQETFERSKLQWPLLDAEPHKKLFHFYEALIALRKANPVLKHLNRQLQVEAFPEKQSLMLHRWQEEHHLLCLMNFSKEQQSLVPAYGGSEWNKIFDSADPQWNGPAGSPDHITNGETVTLQPESFLIYSSKHV